nr:hypothetical protein [Thermococcus sp. 2319x1]
MEVMYSLGIGSAYLTSVLATFGIIPEEFNFYEASVLLMAFLLLGRFLEARAKGRTNEAIKKLMGLYEVEESKVLPGKGVQGVINGKEVLVVSLAS